MILFAPFKYLFYRLHIFNLSSERNDFWHHIQIIWSYFGSSTEKVNL